MSVQLEKVRSATDVVLQEHERFRLGPNLELGTEDELSVLLPSDRLLWGSLAAVQDGPSDGDPLFGWYLTGELATLVSDDYEDAYEWLTLDHENALLTIGGAGLDVTLFGLTAGDIVIGGAGNLLDILTLGDEGALLRAGASAPGYTTFTVPATVAAGKLLRASAANVLTEGYATDALQATHSAGNQTSWTPDYADGPMQKAVATAALTVNAPTNFSSGQTMLLDINTGGFNVTFSASYAGAELTFTGGNWLFVTIANSDEAKLRVSAMEYTP